MNYRKSKSTRKAGKRKIDKRTSNLDRCTMKIVENPSNALAYFARAREEKQRGDFKAAIRDYNLGLQLDSRNAKALVNRAILFTLEFEFTKAIADLTQAIALDPYLLNAHLARANAYKCAGMYPEAILDYNEVLFFVPDCAEAYTGRGETKFLQDNPQGAIADYNLAGSLDPSSKEPYPTMEQLKRALADVEVNPVVQPIFRNAVFVFLMKYYHRLKEKFFPLTNSVLFILFIQLNDFQLDF
jgi:tetratricopeptide (TPR) repeat protein